MVQRDAAPDARCEAIRGGRGRGSRKKKKRCRSCPCDESPAGQGTADAGPATRAHARPFHVASACATWTCCTTMQEGPDAVADGLRPRNWPVTWASRSQTEICMETHSDWLSWIQFSSASFLAGGPAFDRTVESGCVQVRRRRRGLVAALLWAALAAGCGPSEHHPTPAIERPPRPAESSSPRSAPSRAPSTLVVTGARSDHRSGRHAHAREAGPA